MCQFNYTIVKNEKSVSYLRKLGYGCLRIFPGDYMAFGGNRPGSCDCGSMVGSESLKLKEEGKYPFELSADDYRRAIRLRVKLLDEAIQRKQSPEFEAEVRALEEALAPIKKQQRKLFDEKHAKLSNTAYDPTAWLPTEEENALTKQCNDLFAQKDAVFLEAYSHSLEQMMAEKNQKKSWNYNMREFRYYRRIFKQLLEYEPYICFTHIFDEPGELKLVKTLRLAELKIGDLAMLQKDDVLRICK